MAVKTFTNEQLTASDTNTYLANSGLVYVTSKTWTTTSSAQQIDGCFTSTYDSYRIIFTGTGSATTITNMSCKMTSGGTPATGIYAFLVQWSTVANTPYSYWTGGGAANWEVSWIGNEPPNSFTVDLHNPKKASPTTGNATGYGWGSSQVVAGQFYLFCGNSNQYDGIWFSPTSGTWSGTITVYGYRKA